MMLLKKERSNTEDTQDSSRCDDQDDYLPDIIPVSSLASFSDSSTMSSTLSPGAGAPISPSPPLPVRSIFKSYWSSPHHHRDGQRGGGYHGSVVVEDKKKSKEEELLHKLALPFVDEGDSSSSSLPSSSSSSGNITNTTTTLRKSSSAQAAPIKTTTLPTIPQRSSSIDDTTIDYSMKNKSRSPITPRRQILPSVAAPPPPSPLHATAETGAATLSSVQDQARFNCKATPLGGGSSRTWSSTTSLIKRPTHSCLRPSRYSCSIIDERSLSSLHQELNNDKTVTKDEEDGGSSEEKEATTSAIEARSQMKRSKSVSFYSEVSVFEFFVCNKLFDNPHGCSSEGWSKYFTA